MTAKRRDRSQDDILVALCGLTPQVVTETVWALTRLDPPVWPKEIWILTTEAGRQMCRQMLFGETGALARFQRDYDPHRLHRLRYGSEYVVVLRDRMGQPIDDVRTAADNLAIADQLATFLRRQTARPNVRVHCSVAGGRKTMGILLAAVFQLYGRPDDRLYHVLVSPEFESHPAFFYKPRRSTVLRGANGRRLRTSDAVIELADIPYVRLRPLLSQPLPSRFTELVERTQQELQALTSVQPVRLVADRNQLRIGSQTVSLTPQGWELYRALADRKRLHCVRPEQPHCDGCTDCYVRVGKESWDEVRTAIEQQSGRSGILPKDLTGFRSMVSKLNQAIRSALGSERLASRYGIQSVGIRNNKAYGVAVDKAMLKETESPDAE